MFTYWHMHNLRGSVLSKIPLGCFSQREPAAETTPPHPTLKICALIRVVYWFLLPITDLLGALTHNLSGEVMGKGYVLAGTGAFIKLLQLARFVGCDSKGEHITMFSGSRRCEPVSDSLSVKQEGIFARSSVWNNFLLSPLVCLYSVQNRLHNAEANQELSGFFGPTKHD